MVATTFDTKTRGRPRKITENNVLVFLETAGLEYKATGVSVVDAIMNLSLNYTNIKLKGNFVFVQNDKRVEKLVPMKLLRMIFANKLRRAGFANQIETLLKS